MSLNGPQYVQNVKKVGLCDNTVNRRYSDTAGGVRHHVRVTDLAICSSRTQSPIQEMEDVSWTIMCAVSILDTGSLAHTGQHCVSGSHLSSIFLHMGIFTHLHPRDLE